MCGCGNNCTVPTGTPGTPGSVWHNDVGVPANNLGVVGDYYLNTTNGDVYKKTATSTWTLQGNIKGATGATGASGTTVIYDDWTAVQNSNTLVFEDLKTTGSAVPILADGDSLHIETGFTILIPTVTPPYIRLKLLYGNIVLYSAISLPVTSSSTITLNWQADVVRISDLLLRFKSNIQFVSGAGSVQNVESYFTNSDTATPSLTTGSIIKTQVRSIASMDTECNYLRISYYKI